MAHSLPFAPLEMEIAAFFLPFEWLEAGGMRREEQGMRREGSIGWREGGGMAHSLPFAPLEMEIAAFCLAFEWREAEGMKREEQGMRHEEVFAGHEAPSEWEEAGGMRLAGLVARRFAPALFDNRWSKQGSGWGTLLCSHPYLSNRLRRPRFRSPAAGTGVGRRPARPAGRAIVTG